jgi:hypothetical protein
MRCNAELIRLDNAAATHRSYARRSGEFFAVRCRNASCARSLSIGILIPKQQRDLTFMGTHSNLDSDFIELNLHKANREPLC